MFFGYFWLKFDWRKILLVIYSTQPSQKFMFSVQPPPFDHCVFKKKHWFTFLFKEAGCKRHDGIIVGGSILLPKQPRDRTWTSQTAFLKYITHFETLSSKSLQFKKAIRELQHKFLERKENNFLFGTTSYYYRTIYQPLLL